MDITSARELTRRYPAYALPQVRATATADARIDPRLVPTGERELLLAAAVAA